MVGQLYPKNDGRLDGAFTIFYMGINLGAFFSPLVCGFLGDTGDVSDFKWGFLAAGIGMIISVITFELLKNKYIVDPDGRPVGMPPTIEKAKQEEKAVTTPVNFGKMAIIGICSLVIMALLHYQFELDLIGAFIFTCSLAVPALIITDSSLDKKEKERIWVIFILAFFVIFFWSAFEQAGASLTIFADQQTDRSVGSWEMPASWFQSINPLGIILLAPLFGGLWVGLNRRKLEPSSPLKMAMGLGLLCLGYVVIAVGVNGVDASTKISMWWLIALYVLHTMGELCLSPIGLSMVSKLAPVRFASLLMGTWFLANASANKLAGSLSALIPPAPGDVGPEGYPSLLGFEITNLFQFFNIFLIMSGVAAILLFVLYRHLIKLMHGVN
jgi:POT family proton-dependent oligopeptide transporter